MFRFTTLSSAHGRKPDKITKNLRDTQILTRKMKNESPDNTATSPPTSPTPPRKTNPRCTDARSVRPFDRQSISLRTSKMRQNRSTMSPTQKTPRQKFLAQATPCRRQTPRNRAQITQKSKHKAGGLDLIVHRVRSARFDLHSYISNPGRVDFSNNPLKTTKKTYESQ